MDADVTLAAQQLARLRGMNRRYHDRFFAEIRYSVLVGGAAFVLGATVDAWFFVAVPVIALMGAASTAFCASYLIFARHFAARLETWLADRTGSPLVAHRLEAAYLFPLDRPKIVTLAPGSGFTWFGFMTVFYTIIGVASFATGVGLVVDTMFARDAVPYGTIYLVCLGLFTVLTLAVGLWWFVGNRGEQRLRKILDETFGPTDF